MLDKCLEGELFPPRLSKRNKNLKQNIHPLPPILAKGVGHRNCIAPGAVDSLCLAPVCNNGRSGGKGSDWKATQNTEIASDDPLKQTGH